MKGRIKTINISSLSLGWSRRSQIGGGDEGQDKNY